MQLYQFSVYSLIAPFTYTRRMAQAKYEFPTADPGMCFYSRFNITNLGHLVA